MSPLDQLFGSWPPLITALGALGLVLGWQSCGTLLLASALRSTGLARGWCVTLAWLMWPPLCGAVAACLALAQLGRAGLFQGLALLVVLAAAASAWRHRAWWRWQPTWPQFGQYSRLKRWSVGLVLALQLLQLLFAGHPERFYDQFSYHLVVAKQVLAFGGIPYRAFDPHLLIAGLIEYAFLWPRSFVPSDLFMIGVGQIWVYTASVFPCVAAAYLTARRVGGAGWGWVALAAVAAIPGLVPNNEMFSIAKPNALLFAAALVVLLARLERPRVFPGLAFAFALLFSACNPTFIHASLALAAAAVWELWRQRQRPELPWAPLLVGAFCFVVALTRSYVLTKTFFYPADSRFLATPFSDQEALAYWHWIANPDEQSIGGRMLGGLDVLRRGPGLAVWCGFSLVALAFAAWGRRHKAVPWTHVGWFLATFVLIWPLFYDSNAYTRFVAGYVGGLVALGCLAALALPSPWRQGLAGVAIIGGFACSSADVIARKFINWNRGDVVTELAGQFPRMLTAFQVNAWTTKDDTVLTEEAEKYFFTAAVLSGRITPQERIPWAELTAQPQAAARKYAVKAVVIEAPPTNERVLPAVCRWCGPVREVFEKLKPFGEIYHVNGDLVLRSDCNFRAKPCPAASVGAGASSASAGLGPETPD